MKQSILLLLFLHIIFHSAIAQKNNKLLFSELEWHVKVAQTPTGPGNNFFGMHKKNVHVDKKGRLHLRIKKISVGWSCAEIISSDVISEGQIVINIDSKFAQLNANMVLGLFLYNETDTTHNEVDIEFSQWGDLTNMNAQYVIQNERKPQIHRFNIKKSTGQTQHIINIKGDSILFKSYLMDKKGRRGQIIGTSSFLRPPNLYFKNTHFRFNLWLCDNQGLKRHLPQIIINSFKYIPN